MHQFQYDTKEWQESLTFKVWFLFGSVAHWALAQQCNTYFVSLLLWKKYSLSNPLLWEWWHFRFFQVILPPCPLLQIVLVFNIQHWVVTAIFYHLGNRNIVAHLGKSPFLPKQKNMWKIVIFSYVSQSCIFITRI